MHKFENVNLFISGNTYLREPQVEAYLKIKEYFATSEITKRKEALVVLPTGTGKTGVIAIAPYAVSKKRTLVITPQTVIADTVMGSLDSSDYKNFWYTSKVIDNISDLPSVVHYNKKVTKGTLDLSDIIVVNIHKLQERLENSLIKKVDSDYFDFIIIDEAHHAEAYTWKKTLEHFNQAHVLKLTGTPFRSDGVEIQGDKIYSYSLSKAMANGYVKSLEKFNYAPEKMFFTIDNIDDKIYSLDEIKKLKLKNSEWISRNVALSKESNLGVVKESIIKLNEKKGKTNNPHKIVAVACSIAHANQLKELYENENLRVSIVHSSLDKSVLKEEFLKIDNHKVDVVINVALLGEGYDHKFLSVAAIFRPFRSDLPYQQFIGRVLRTISPTDTNNISPEDNIASVVVHEELGLDLLWEQYKKEIIKSGMIKDIRKDLAAEKKLNNGKYKNDSTTIQESENHSLISDTFINTALLKERQIKEKEEQNKVEEIMNTLNISESEARKIVISVKSSPDSQTLLRPDLAQANLRKKFDDRIKEEIIPELLVNNNLDLQGEELYNVKEKIFPLRVVNALKPFKKNGAILAFYFSLDAKNNIGTSRDNWEIDDFHVAFNRLDKILPFIEAQIKAFT